MKIFDDFLTASQEIEKKVEEVEPVLQEYEIDFSTMTLTGRMIEGLNALKQTIKIRLGTQRYFYNQYSWDHGVSFDDFIGKTYPKGYVENQVKRMIKENLQDLVQIMRVYDYNIEYTNDKLNISFTIDTIYGTETIETEV